MSKAARAVGPVAVAFLAACGSGTGPDAGTTAEYDGGMSFGTATLSGAATGTAPVTAWVVASRDSDGGSTLNFSVGGQAQLPAPFFYCSGSFPGSSLVPGSFTPPELDERDLGCALLEGTDQAFQAWQVVTAFVLNINSPGPAYPTNTCCADSPPFWPYPSGSLTVTLAPYPEYTYGNATVNVTFGPPPQ